MPVPIAAAIAEGAGIIQAGIGLIQEGRANKQLKRLFKQRKAFETPEEIFEILQMNQYASQTGYSPDTLQYLTGQADRGLSASLGSATRLGADPNAIGGILDGYFQDIFKIGNENELLKMQKFDKLINAELLLSANKEAEQISADNLIKDQMAAVASKVQAGQQNLQSGVNTSLSALAAMAKYYDDPNSTGGTSQSGSGGLSNRGLLDYVPPDLSVPSGRPIPRNRSIFR